MKFLVDCAMNSRTPTRASAEKNRAAILYLFYLSLSFSFFLPVSSVFIMIWWPRRALFFACSRALTHTQPHTPMHHCTLHRSSQWRQQQRSISIFPSTFAVECVDACIFVHFQFDWCADNRCYRLIGMRSGSNKGVLCPPQIANTVILIPKRLVAIPQLAIICALLPNLYLIRTQTQQRRHFYGGKMFVCSPYNLGLMK